MFAMNAWITVPLYTLCAITMHHKTAEGKRDKRYRNLSHRIEVISFHSERTRVAVFGFFLKRAQMGTIFQI